jgi:hypothetical protein
MPADRKQEVQFKDDITDAVKRHIHCFSRLCDGVQLSTDEEDTRFSFDLRVGFWLPVSVRLRTAEYFKFRDFSVRCKTRYSGQTINGITVQCELDKLRAGYGNCYFTGWLSRDQARISHYILVDINALRPHLDAISYSEKANGDGTAGRYYKLDALQDIGALVYQSWDEDEYILTGASNSYSAISSCPL